MCPSYPKVRGVAGRHLVRSDLYLIVPLCVGCTAILRTNVEVRVQAVKKIIVSKSREFPPPPSSPCKQKAKSLCKKSCIRYNFSVAICYHLKQILQLVQTMLSTPPPPPPPPLLLPRCPAIEHWCLRSVDLVPLRHTNLAHSPVHFGVVRGLHQQLVTAEQVFEDESLLVPHGHSVTHTQ